MQKRGLSTVVITLIIILISLVAVGIVWVVVRNVIQTGTKEVTLGQFTLDAKIKDVNVYNFSNNVSLTVKRNPGVGEFSRMNFVFYDGKNSEVVTQPVSLNELEEKWFMFHLSTLNVSNLISISIFPYVKQDEKEILGNILDKYTVGTQGSAIILPVCVPATCASLGYECGTNWANGTNCAGTLNCEPPNCTTRYGLGYNCNSAGRCFFGTCTPLINNYCSIMGYECGYWGNNSCSGNLSCGTCGTGTCNAGGRCVSGTILMTRNISQFGITWTFDKEYPYGKFANGDYWVVGPVNIIDINPKSINDSGRIIHGSMLNPRNILSQGYDSMMYGRPNSDYVNSLNVGRPNGSDISALNPLNITTGSLISGISIPLNGADANRVNIMAILTVLDSVPPNNSFRPPYVGTNKNIRHTLSEVNVNSIPQLAVPAGLSRWENDMNISLSLNRFEKPWVEHVISWNKEMFCPRGNMPNYGREVAYYVSVAVLKLMLNISQVDPVLNETQAQKELLMIRFLQFGLDTYGISQEPNGSITWTADGGHMPGRAFPILFAGYMFKDSAMLGIMDKSGQYAYENGHYAGNIPSDYIHFGEIDQTFYVTERDVNCTHNIGCVWSPDTRSTLLLPYEMSDIGLPVWGIAHVHSPAGDNKYFGAIYEQVNTPSWLGFILASHVLNITSNWNHQPIMDYVDRWTDIINQSGNPQVGRTDMDSLIWFTHRNNYDCTWFRINPSDTYSQGNYNCAGVIVNCSNILILSDYPNQRARNYNPCRIGG